MTVKMLINKFNVSFYLLIGFIIVTLIGAFFDILVVKYVGTIGALISYFVFLKYVWRRP